MDNENQAPNADTQTLRAAIGDDGLTLSSNAATVLLDELEALRAQARPKFEGFLDVSDEQRELATRIAEERTRLTDLAVDIDDVILSQNIMAMALATLEQHKIKSKTASELFSGETGRSQSCLLLFAQLARRAYDTPYGALNELALDMAGTFAVVVGVCTKTQRPKLKKRSRSVPL